MSVSLVSGLVSQPVLGYVSVSVSVVLVVVCVCPHEGRSLLHFSLMGTGLPLLI